MRLQVQYVSGDDIRKTFWGKSKPQTPEIQLDLLDGILTAGYQHNYNGPLWLDSYLKTWEIPFLSTEEIRLTLDAIAPLAQRAVDGYDTVEGNDPGSEIADMSSDGESALLEIGTYLKTKYGTP